MTEFAALLRQPNVLVVEDESLIRMMLCERLREDDYDVTEANNADEALRMMADSLPNILVTDIRMPGSMDGIDLVKIVRANHPTLPIIVVSANITCMGQKDDHTEFMLKPYPLDHVVERIEMLLQAATGGVANKS